MGIDFRDPANRRTYSGREADASWRDAVTALVDAAGADVVDIGCGGGTYLRAWHDLGAATVTGVDSSAPILDAARESHGHLPGISFHHGDAAATGLDEARADVVFERALVHHVPDLGAVAVEAARILRPGGILLIQDRTPEDVAQPGSVDHPRGWLFDLHPRLLDVENGRRAPPRTRSRPRSAPPASQTSRRRPCGRSAVATPTGRTTSPRSRRAPGARSCTS